MPGAFRAAILRNEPLLRSATGSRAELERARSHVHLAGWYFSPEFALTRFPRPTVLRNLLAEVAERVDVRVLAWAGAALPLFRPSRRQAEGRSEKPARTRVRRRGREARRSGFTRA